MIGTHIGPGLLGVPGVRSTLLAAGLALGAARSAAGFNPAPGAMTSRDGPPSARASARRRDRRDDRPRAVPHLPAAQADHVDRHRGVHRRRAVGAGQLPPAAQAARLAITIVYLGLILIPVMIGAILVPPLVKEANKLVDNVPAVRAGRPGLRRQERDAAQARGGLQHHREARRSRPRSCPAKLGGAAGVLSDIGLGIVNSLFALVTILDPEPFMIGSGRPLGRRRSAAAPPSTRMLRRPRPDRARRRRLRRGRARPGDVAGVTAFIVLSILGVPYAAALALIIALLDLVPLVGATIGASIVGIVTVFNDFPTDTIIWVVWSIVYQQIENTVIQPRIQAHTVQGPADRRADRGAVRLDAVRGARRAAGDPGGGDDPDLDPRVPRFRRPVERWRRCRRSIAERRRRGSGPAPPGRRRAARAPPGPPRRRRRAVEPPRALAVASGAGRSDAVAGGLPRDLGAPRRLPRRRAAGCSPSPRSRSSGAQRPPRPPRRRRGRRRAQMTSA